MAKSNSKNSETMVNNSVETKVVCPKCGASFAIPAREFMAAGMVIGKDSNLGTIYLQMEDCNDGHVAHLGLSDGRTVEQVATDMGIGVGATKAQTSRLDALKDKGIDVSGFFSLPTANGETIVKIEDGVPVAVSDDTLDGLLQSVSEEIYANGYIKNSKLHRRWVMAQYFWMSRQTEWSNGFTDALNHRGYDYQWKTLVDELNAQAHMAGVDRECLDARIRWFNKKLACDMAKDYIVKLRRVIDTLPKRKCKGKSYVRISGRNIFVYDLAEKVFNPMNDLCRAINDTRSAKKLHEAVLKFYNEYVRLGNVHQYGRWQSAFKGAGAYYTAQNLIKFHGCKVHDGDKVLNMYDSLQMLESKAEEYKADGWRLFAWTNKLIDDNGFDYEARMRELGVRK